MRSHTLPQTASDANPTTNGPPDGLPRNMEARISADKYSLLLTVSEPLASYKFLYLREEGRHLHLSPQPQEGHVKCPVYKGGHVIFFRAISEDSLDELVDEHCEYIPPQAGTRAEEMEALDYTTISGVSPDDHRGTCRRFVRVFFSNDPIAEAMKQSDRQTPEIRKTLFEYAERVLVGRHQQLDDAAMH